MEKNNLLKGTGASPGIVIGKALLVDHGRPDFSHYRLAEPKEIQQEIDYLHRAIEESKSQLLKAKKEVGKRKLKEAQYIIDTHILILQDKVLINNATKKIKNDRIDAAWALKATMGELKKNLAGIADEYMQERISDLDYIEKRILS